MIHTSRAFKSHVRKYAPPSCGVNKVFPLDLFSGTGSVGQALKNLGFTVISLDINPKFKPNLVCDILKWK